MAEAMVEAVKLTKAYNGTKVVDGLNLKIAEGQVFGFVGPNGAGKTTSILMLLGLTEPTSGTARIAGFNSTREPLKVKRVSGYVPEKVGFYDDLTAGYNLAYIARLNCVSAAEIDKRIADALEVVGLADKVAQKVGTFSKGMKQRLAIADLLVKEPKVAFLDEPTTSIDPEGIGRMLDLIARIAKERKMTIVLSSHQLHQVERICQRVGIMAKGRLVVEGPIEQLRAKAKDGGVSVEIRVTEIKSAILDAIEKIQGVQSVERSGDVLIVSCSADLRPQIARAIIDNQGMLVEMKVQSQTLENIYLKYLKGD